VKENRASHLKWGKGGYIYLGDLPKVVFRLRMLQGPCPPEDGEGCGGKTVNCFTVSEREGGGGRQNESRNRKGRNTDKKKDRRPGARIVSRPGVWSRGTSEGGKPSLLAEEKKQQAPETRSRKGNPNCPITGSRSEGESSPINPTSCQGSLLKTSGSSSLRHELGEALPDHFSKDFTNEAWGSRAEPSSGKVMTAGPHKGPRTIR